LVALRYTKWLFVHCLVSFSNRGHRLEGINYLLLGMKIGSPINDRHNLGASHFIAISGIRMRIIATYGQPLTIAHAFVYDVHTKLLSSA